MSEVPEVVVVVGGGGSDLEFLMDLRSLVPTLLLKHSQCRDFAVYRRFPILHDILQYYLMYSHQGAFCLQPVVTTATNPLVREHGK